MSFAKRKRSGRSRTRESIRAAGLALRASAGVACALVASAGCKAKHDARDDASTPRDAAPSDAGVPWPELEELPHVQPARVVPLPVQAKTPRFDIGGPVVAGEVAVVSSSQFGFLAIDYRRGQIAWSKPAGLHVAPPLARRSDVVLIGDCVTPPDVPDGERLLGCLRVVTPTGADQGYVAVHGRDVDAFATSAGPQATWSSGDRTITWRRGDQAIAIDVVTGVATPAPTADPPLVIHYKERTWQITRGDDGEIAATEKGKPAWSTKRPYTALIGAVHLPDQVPTVRVARAGAFAGHPEVMIFDLDATGSMNGSVALPVPGIQLWSHAIDAVGDTALAIRLDASLERDFIVGYAANALIMWVYELPHQPRADAVGLAIAPDAVIAFHDGDTLTVLPQLSAPPTAPGAVRVPSENATP